MIRSAAKNHRFVLVVTSPDRYEKVLGDLREHKGSSCGKHRLKQAQRAFAHTAEYDALIAQYLAQFAGATLASPSSGAQEMPATQASPLPENLHLALTKKQTLRYGENPHQAAALYVGGKPTEASVAFAKQLHGKELSYINLLDADAALSAVKELSTPTACIVKHATPCGFAAASDLPTAFRNAFAGDPLAAFGGIVALNKPVDRATAEAITSIDKLLEVIVAPTFDADALELLRSRWKNVRLLEVGAIGTPDANEMWMHKIVGGYLVQERDLTGLNESDWKIVSSRAPTARELADLRIAWLACKHVKSNAIVVAKDQMMLGSGAGQQDRVNACRIAIQKAGDRVKGSVAASDAFFPFPDGPHLLLDAGVTALIHPGGSVKDQETIDLVNARGATMILTGQRHFRH
jgi:phosphoribosylaminoimidazolecarboxamide formyltransferase/IMP cyclohydrolase